MKKIFSIFIFAVAGILSASASQTFTVTSVNNSQTIYFRISKTSGSVTRSKTSNSGSAGTVSLTVNDTYWQTFAVTTGSNSYKTLTITLPDDVTYLEIYNNKANVSAINVTGMTTYLASLNLNGCTNLTTLTLGTMSALTDIDVSNTSAAVAYAITAAKCPVLENLNVANCGLTSLAYAGTTLYSLDVTGNSITSLNLSGNANLDIVRCESNSMTSLTVATAVTTISAQSNNLTTLTGYGEPIKVLDVANNGLTTLSMNGLDGLTDLDISSNHLTFRSFPSAENKPARMLYAGNDGQYDFSASMKAAFGSYSYPLQSKLPNYASRNETAYTIDLTEARLDGHDVQSVVPVVNSYNGTTDTPLTLSNSDVDGNDYAKSTDGNLYGFMKPQSRVRFSFTNANYPGLILYSNEFTVPDGVTGTLRIVDEDGTELYSIANAFFSDASDGIPADARRDYTKYTYSAVPTTAGQTWTVTAGPSDDAPFAWAKTYNSATWYYLGLKDKWVTAGEQLYQLGGRQGNNGHKLKDTYSTSDDNYQWAFVGNQYDGFKIYNKGRGSGETLQDYAGFNTVSNQYGYFPVMKSGESLKWIVRTNSAGMGFSLENKAGGTDYSNGNGGVSAPAFLNDFQGLGGLNYWITADYDAQNDVGSLLTVLQASGAVSPTVKWVLMDGSNPVYTLTQDVTAGQSINAYPTELTTMASQRFVTLPSLTPFTPASGENRKEIAYTWTGPFQLTTDTDNPHLYFFKSTRYGYYAYAPSSSTGQAKQATYTKNWVTPRGRWFFTGDPFNGIEIRPYAYPETGLVNSTLSTTPTKYIPKANPDITTNYWDNALPSAAVSFLIPNSSNCLAEQLGTWSAAAINSDKGLSFVVEDAEDISMLIESGLYHVRCMGSGLTLKYWKLGSDHKLYNDGDPANMNTVFRIEENINTSNGLPDSYYIAGFDGNEAWYLDNTRTGYSQQFTATQTAANYMPAQIIYNAKADGVPYYAIKLSNQSDYSGYSYANTNGGMTQVVTYNYTSGTADGSAWAFEPVMRVALNAVGDKSYATFYFDRDLQTDENTKAYYITTTDNGYAQLTEVDNDGHNIPAYTAVVLINSAQASSSIFTVTSGLSSVVDADVNLLKGTLTSMTLDLSSSSPYYSMGRLNGQIGFYKFNSNGTTSITLGAHKAFLEVPGASNSNGFTLTLDDVTGINEIVNSKSSNSKCYDLWGRKVAVPQKGEIYIVNGKKLIMK